MPKPSLDRMFYRTALGAFVLTMLGVLAYTSGASGGGAVPAPSVPLPRPSGANRTPVLVELFTSEGCSSCPPADDELARLEREQPVDGVTIVPLAFHVDYWDGLGWPDPFGSPAFTDRQRAYGSIRGRQSIYTPQAVVDGQDEMVGSNDDKVRRSIASAADSPKARVTVRVLPIDAKHISLEIDVGALPVGAADAEVIVAVTEGPLHVDVRRGENAGRKLDHTAVVRALHLLGNANPAGTSARSTIELTPSAVLPRAVVFVQERGRTSGQTKRVLGVGTVALRPT